MQQQLVAGTTLNFLTAGGDFPATDGWALKFYLRRRSGAGSINLTATAEGADHRVSVTAATTAGWTAGDYAWESRAEKGAEKYPVESGQITILPDITASSGTFDSRSQAQKALEDANAAYATFTASGGTRRRYRIGEREVEFTSAAEIVRTISYWTNEVRRAQRAEALAKGLADPRKTYVRLDRA